MTMITDGKYRARAVGPVVLGQSKNKGTPFVECYFEITDGPNKGGTVRWQGYFTDKTSERTIQSLYYCGFAGDDLGVFADGALHGLDKNEVSIEVEIETYESNGETRETPRVAWVNRLGGFLNVEQAMSASQAQAFGDRLKGLAQKVKSGQKGPKNEAPPSGREDAPF